MKTTSEKINILIIFIVSISANFYYGSIGVFPIDTFAFFDSANLINQGFFPIRDYWTSNGFLVDYMQSIFFKFFGVNWKIYLLHSSLINFVFAMTTYKFLINEGLTKETALFYSISAGILAYPSAGVPFPDHHSLIFSIIGAYFFIFSIKNKSNLFLFFTVLFLIIAFLCKQVPAAFFMILIGSYLIYISFKSKSNKLIFYATIYAIVLIAIFVLFLVLKKIEIKNFLTQYIFFPLSIGSERSNNLSTISILKSLLNEFKFFSIFSLIILFQLIKKKNNNSQGIKNTISTKVFFLLLILVIIINQLLMKNQIIIFFFLPVLLGIIHIETKTFHQKKYIIPIILICNILITFKYHERFNENRKFIELENINTKNFIKGENISKKLKGLKWVTSNYDGKLSTEVKLLQESITFLKNNKENSIIITYYQFINSELNHNIYPPNRWYTSDGVSYPLKNNKFYESYKKFFEKKLIEKEIIKIFTIKPLDKDVFIFSLKSNCVQTSKINDILSEHNITNCFAKNN